MQGANKASGKSIGATFGLVQEIFELLD